MPFPFSGRDYIVKYTKNNIENDFIYSFNATKEIAALKFQEYIIRKLYIEDTNQFGTGDLEKGNSEIPTKAHRVKKYTDGNKEAEKLEWYVQWRNKNLK